MRCLGCVLIRLSQPDFPKEVPVFRSARGPMVWLVPLAVIVLATVLIGVVIANQDSPDDSATAQKPDSQSESGSSGEEIDLSFVEHRVEDDSRALGDVDAPVTLVMFSDYQCPYCASWNAETMPTMMEYVDKGDLRIEMRDLAVFGEESERAARAAYAAGLQGKYWEFHNAMFEGGEHPPKSELDDDSLVATAQDLGLDPTKFKGDMNSVEAHDEFEANAQEGYSLGVTSTPTFVIGGKPLVGAQPTKEFVSAVDNALAEAEG
ncbi:DsbA family protein [Brevibacterium picturae]|uniref:Thioredoxin domain-containing protein n=1 Tax=Brevibacterium picturae TaxID=260553 RepID=A0ABP4NCI1_9MICO